MSLRANEGTISFLASHADQDWATNGRDYKFGPTPDSPDGVAIVLLKHANRTLEVRVADAVEFVTFNGPVQAVKHPGLQVTVTWDAGVVDLYLDGQKVDKVTLPKA